MTVEKQNSDMTFFGSLSNTSHASDEAGGSKQSAETGDNRELARRYDVRNITSTELNRLGRELYDEGRISRELCAMLSFQPELNPSYQQVGAPDVAPPDPNAPRDAVEEWRKILETQETFGTSSYFIDMTRNILHLLESLEHTKPAGSK